MFETTLEAANIFANSLRCSNPECNRPCDNLHLCGESCKHPFCWDCINLYMKSNTYVLCPRCKLPLDLMKVHTAKVFNNLSGLLSSLQTALANYGKGDTGGSGSSETQHILTSVNKEKDAPRTIVDFCSQMVTGEGVEERSPSPDMEKDKSVSNEPEDAFIEESPIERSLVEDLDFHIETSGLENIGEPMDHSTQKHAGTVPSMAAVPDLFASQMIPKWQPSPAKKKMREAVMEHKKKVKEEAFDLPDEWIQESKARVARISGVPTPPAPIRQTKSMGGETMKKEPPPTKSRSHTIRKAVVEMVSPEKKPSSRRTSVVKELSKSPVRKSPRLSKGKKEDNIEEKEMKVETDVYEFNFDQPQTSKSARRSIRQISGEKTRASMEKEMSTEREMVHTQTKRKKSIGGKKGETVLINAVIRGDAAKTASAIEAGADPNERDPDGKTPVYLAAERNRSDLCSMLIEAGAVVNAVCGEECNTALHAAAAYGCKDAVRILLSRGASRRARNLSGKRPEEVASTEDVRVLIARHTSVPLQIVYPLRPDRVLYLHDSVRAVKRKKATDEFEMSTSLTDSTHFVVGMDSKDIAQCTTQLLEAMLHGLTIVSDELLEGKGEEEEYEVKKVRNGEMGIIQGGCITSRKNAQKMLPPLWCGARFYLCHQKYGAYTKNDLLTLIKAGGGTILSREPVPTGDELHPFHSRETSPFFVLFNPFLPVSGKLSNNLLLNMVSYNWLVESILRFEMVKPY